MKIVHADEIAEEEGAYSPPFDGEKLSYGRRLAQGRAMGAWRERLPPGRRTSFTHAHRHEEEIVFVIEGTPSVRWIVPGQPARETPLRPGSTVTFEAGEDLAHTIVNHGPGDAVLFVVGERRLGEAAWYAEDDGYVAWLHDEHPSFPFLPGPDPGARPPAYRIETERLVLRPWRPEEAHAVRDLVARNQEHLRESMPWARETPTIDGQVALLRGFRAKFDADEDYVYGVLLDARQPIGGTGVHPRVGPGGIEIGYWIDRAHEGRGFVTEWVAALCRVAFEAMGQDRVEIRCHPDNARSAAVPRRLGFTLEGVLKRRFRDGETLRDQMVWTLFRENADQVAAAKVRAFDALGRRLL